MAKFIKVTSRINGSVYLIKVKSISSIKSSGADGCIVAYRTQEVSTRETLSEIEALLVAPSVI